MQRDAERANFELSAKTAKTAKYTEDRIHQVRAERGRPGLRFLAPSTSPLPYLVFLCVLWCARQAWLIL